MVRRRLALASPLFLALVLAGCPADPAPVDASLPIDAVASDAPPDARACTSDDDCDDALFCTGEETCEDGRCTTAPRACDDGIACTIDTCSEERGRCESAPPDADGDGIGDAACLDDRGDPLGDDCDDDDADRFPGNTEVCDAAHDEDCDPTTHGGTDADGDGYESIACCNGAVSSGERSCGSDCDDALAGVHPDEAEACDGIDTDCDLAIDEGVPTAGYLPDCDGDGSGDASATPVVGCAPPASSPSCASGGAWVTMAGDCADADPNRHVGAPEVCNGLDDDCDARTDDIIDGAVVCASGQTRPCTTTCSLAGSQLCNDACLGWDTCTAAEVCNGCDDDDDGADDDGFECIQGASGACTTACGTAGTRLCGATCSYGSCTASEACNYCDDDLDGNFHEERPLASTTSTDRLQNCVSGAYEMFGTGTSCDTEPTPSGFDLWAELLDGTANDQAGALWFSPASWSMGWGSIELDVEMEVTAVSAGGMYEMPLGGWAVLVSRGGTPGVGTAQAGGVPTGLTGVGARWYWSTYDSCYFPTRPPSADDSVRGIEMGGPQLRAVGTPTDSTCYSGDGLNGAATDFDGPSSGTLAQRIQLRYTPDDPTTAAVDEEELLVTSTSGAAITRTYIPTDAIAIGDGPLRIGITAGTFTQTGFMGPPAGARFGVPVRARVRIMNHQNNCCGPPTITYPRTIVRRGICP